MKYSFSKNSLALLLCMLLINFNTLANVSEYSEDADKNYEKALISFENADIKSAVIHLKNTFQTDKNHLPGRILYAQMLLAHNSGEAAMAEITHAKSLGADIDLLLPLEAEAYLHQQKYEKALAVTESGTKSTDIEIALTYFRGQAYLGLGRLLYAEESFGKVLELSPHHSLALLGKAQVFIARKQFTEAKELIAVLMTGYDIPESTYVLKAKLHIVDNETQAAIETLNDALANHPNLLSARLTRAQLYLSQKSFDQAEIDINYLLDRAPKEPRTNYLKALVDSTKASPVLVEQTFDKTLNTLTAITDEIREENPQYLFLTGYLQFRKQQYSQALENLNKYLEKNNDIRAALLMAQIYFIQEEYASAEHILSRARLQHPTHNGIFILLGKTHLQLGNYVEAQKNLIASLGIDNSNLHILLDLAESFIKDKQFNEAKKALDKVAQSFPTLPRMLILQNENYLALRQLTNALYSTQTLINFHQNVAEFHYLHGVNLLKSQQVTSASTAFSQAIALNSEHFASHILLNKIKVNQGQSQLAIDNLTQLLRVHPNNNQVMLALANIYQYLGNEKLQLEWLTKVLAIEPDYIDALKSLIQFYRDKNDLSHAQLTLEQTLKRSKKGEIHQLLANVYLEQRNYKQAILHFSKFAENTPHRVEALLSLANTYVMANDHNEAIATVKKALIWDQNSMQARIMLVKLLLAQHDLEQAQSNIDALPKKKSLLPLIWMLNGDVQFAAKEFHLAKSNYQKAFDLAPSQKALLSLYRSYKKLNQFEEIELILSEWIEQDAHRNDVAAIVALADIYQLNNKTELAIKLYQDALSRNQDSVALLNNLANVLLNAGDIERVRPYIKKAYKLAPKNVTVIDTLAWFHFHLEEFDTALQLLRTAITLDSNNLTVKYHLAETLHRLKRPKAAKKYLLEVLNSPAEFSYRLQAEALIKSL